MYTHRSFRFDPFNLIKNADMRDVFENLYKYHVVCSKYVLVSAWHFEMFFFIISPDGC